MDSRSDDHGGSGGGWGVGYNDDDDDDYYDVTFMSTLLEVIKNCKVT